MKFEIPEDQHNILKEWIIDHNKQCEAEDTAIGGKLSYTFTPTGLGQIININCVCGCILDLTDFDNW